MTFEDLLQRLWGYDGEILAYDSLFVFKNYLTREKKIFHNCSGNEIQEWFDETKPILCAFNCNNYDKHILRGWLAGMNPQELKKVNDYIIGGGNGWDIDVGYMKLPTMWDFFNEINPRKSLKEIEGNLRLNITESKVSFNIDRPLTQEEYEDLLYYCECDVDALFPLFDKLKNDYKSKFIISKLGGIDPEFGLSQTNANLTAILLKAERKNHDDNFIYEYPSCIDKTKIPKEALDYFDDIIAHNDLNYSPNAPELEFDDILFQLGIGGGHAFKKKGTYYYDRRTSKKLLCNWDFTSLYPNLVRLFGYSSRNQSDKDAYVNLLSMRMKAKKKLLSDDFLKPMDLTNGDLNIGLKLPLNAYTGALRAKFNALYDNLQGFSICTTGQLIVLQLIHDLQKIPTLEMVSANTDAVMYEVSPEYKEQADNLIHNLEKLTGLEMEEDKIVRIVMANVNNYCELLETGDNEYSINYKGGNFECNSIKKNLKMIWHKDTETWETKFEDDIKTNSMTIVGEALLKNLLLDIPVEETINNCEDIFRFQIITHLGHTYEKMIQESPNGDIELQRNNRIYAGLKPSGTLVKVKADGRRDSLANCPDNPIVDNANECSIKDVNKNWYIRIAQQRVEDFLGTGKQILKGRKKLMKKDELIEEVTRLEKELDAYKNGNVVCGQQDDVQRLYSKITTFRRKVQEHKFVLDKVLADNLGGGEYHSIGQIYNFVQQTCLEIGLDFSFETVEELRFERDVFKPSVGANRHLSVIKCIACFTDITTGMRKEYTIIGSGSDSIDKSVGSAETMAFRNWFKFNFTPKEEFDWEEEPSIPEVSESVAPKIPAYIPPQAKQEIKQQVVATEQHENSDQEDIDSIVDTIMKIRELTNNSDYGKEQLDSLYKGECDTPTINSLKLAVESRLASIKAGS